MCLSFPPPLSLNFEFSCFVIQENYLTSHEEAVAVENALRTELEKLAQARREADEESRFLREVLAARPEDSEGSAVQLAMQLHDCKERITQLEAELEGVFLFP